MKMSFKRGPQYRFFITTENPSAGIIATGGTCSVKTDSALLGPNALAANLGVSALGDMTGTSGTLSEFKNVEGADPKPGHVDDPFEVFSQTRPIDNPIRTEWTLTLTRKSENSMLKTLYRYARFGATGSVEASAPFDGLTTYPDSTGYRVYVYDGENWDIFYHGTIQADGYTDTLGPSSVTVEQLVLKGGLWRPGVPNTASDLVSILTSSVSIVQA
jgi:hypothetical protein